MEVNFQDFANLCGVSLQKASWALIFRTAGAAFGVFVFGPILSLCPPVRIMFVNLLLIVIILGSFFSVISTFGVDIFYFLFFLLGTLTSINYSCMLIILREAYKKDSGSWLQALSFSFQIGTAILPLLNMMMPAITSYYFGTFLAAAAAAVGILSLQQASPQDQDLENRTIRENSTIFLADVLVAAGGFFIAGIVVETTTYLPAFVTESGISATTNPLLLIFGFNMLVLVGQIIALKLQENGSKIFTVNLFLAFGFGAIATSVAPIIAPSSDLSATVNISVPLLGFFWGPLQGLLFNIWNRCTSEPTAYGAAIVTFGMLTGSGFYSVWMYGLWVHYVYPYFLFWGNFVALSLILCSVVALGYCILTPLDISEVTPCSDVPLGDETDRLIPNKME